MCSIGGECRATKNAKIGFLLEGDPNQADAKEELQLPRRSLGRGPATTGFVCLPTRATTAAQGVYFLLSERTNVLVYLSGDEVNLG